MTTRLGAVDWSRRDASSETTLVAPDPPFGAGTKRRGISCATGQIGSIGRRLLDGWHPAGGTTEAISQRDCLARAPPPPSPAGGSVNGLADQVSVPVMTSPLLDQVDVDGGERHRLSAHV